VAENARGQPTESGWYVGGITWKQSGFDAGHLFVGYYDAARGEFTYSTAIQGGQSIPGAQPDLGDPNAAALPQWQYWRISPGPDAVALAGPPHFFHAHDWEAWMARDLAELEAIYANLDIPYDPLADLSGELDGNSNTYAAFVLACLGIEPAELPPGPWHSAQIVERHPDGAVGIKHRKFNWDPEVFWVLPLRSSYPPAELQAARDDLDR
jgi:hypothetical protein